MRKKISMVVSLGIIVMLLLTGLTVASYTEFNYYDPTPNDDDDTPQLNVSKQVWDGVNWVDELDVTLGSIVRFRISVIYHDTPGNSCFEIGELIIGDVLTDFKYMANPWVSQSLDYPIDHYLRNWSSNNTYIWNFGDAITLGNGQHLYLEFDAQANKIGQCVNVVGVKGLEHCCCDTTVDDAYCIINVGERPEVPAGSLECLKKIWNTHTQQWVEPLYGAFVGETVRFKITFTYTGNYEFENIKVKDILPSSLQYANNANPVQTAQSGQTIFWNLTDTLSNGETMSIEFDAKILAPGTITNIGIITGLIASSSPLYCECFATIFAEEPQGDLVCQKQVWNTTTQQWVEQINAAIGNTVRFKITFTYTGEGSFMNLKVKDILPPCLQYANNANPVETGQSGNIIFWNLSGSLSTGQSASVEFNALVIASGINTNLANITGSINCHIPRYCEDTATVIVREQPQEQGDLICKKQVWNTTTQQWVEQINAGIGNTVRFKINVTYQGSGTLIGIKVKDTLPACLQYANNANPVQSGQTGKIIYWNLTNTLNPGQSIIIQFDALVIASGTNTNLVNVTGLENCIDPLYCDDTATVIVRQPQGGDLLCEKQVWDPATQQWVEQITTDNGNTVRFKITLTYQGSGTLVGIKVKDTLPLGLQYANNANPVQTGQTGKIIYWNLTNTLNPGQSIIIQFDALVLSTGTHQNLVNITGLENCIDPLYCDNSATVIVGPPPDLRCEKKVWDSTTQQWVEQINAKVGDIVRFKITISYWGSLSFYNFWVNDTLPVCLDYHDNAAPYQPTAVNGKHVNWYLPVAILYGQSISLEFDALVVSSGTNVNTVNIIGWECGIRRISCLDTATVIVQGTPDLLCEKKVKDPTTQQWVEQINAKVGEKVRFRINITYKGSLSFYNFWVNDTLPACLQYNDSATPYQPTVVDGKKVKWYILDALLFGGSISIEFVALVISTGTNVNTVNITGIECGIRRLICGDTATVIAENPVDPLVADAHGPYTGYTSESIPFTGSATGGVAPYTYQWDFDNDGLYDDGVGTNPSFSFGSPNTYTIGIKAFDNAGKNDTDTATVTVSIRNTAPNKPSTPDGPATGKTKTDYDFSSSVVDPDGDQVWLWFDWGEGNNSGWVGPFTSGADHEETNRWTMPGEHIVKVQAKDSKGAVSVWSDPFTITLKKKFSIQESAIMDRFPALANLLATLFNILETIRG